MKEKIVIFTGAGISAESGLRTFRDNDGYWNEYPVESVASAEGWAKNPSLVLRFYNERRTEFLKAKPNAAHIAIAKLETQFDVVVITQNIDDLHEQGGSSNVIHVHGEIGKSRSSIDPSLIYSLTKDSIELGELCDKGSQLRPYVVLFGEDAVFIDEACEHITTASKILIVGTSLSVYPAAGLIKKAKFSAEKYLVSPEPVRAPYGYRLLRGDATKVVPHVVSCWIESRKPC